MAKQQPELGVKSPYRIRLGVNGIDRFRGVDREADPGAIRDDQFQDALNVRLTPSGKVLPRGGHSKVNSTAMVGCVDGLIDDEHVEGDLLYWGNDRAAAAADANYISTYTVEQDTEVQGVGPLSSIGSPWAVHNGLLYCLKESGGNSVFQTMKANAGFGAPTPATGFTITGITGLIDAMSHNGDLYILRSPGSAEATVYKYNGTTASADDSSGVTPTTVRHGHQITEHDGDLYYVVPHTSGRVRKRTKSSGAWSTHASFNNTKVSYLTSFRNRLFLFEVTGSDLSETMKVYEVTGGGITQVHDSAIANSDCVSTAVYDGYLYYLIYETSVETYLGRFDGTTWDDTYYQGFNYSTPTGALKVADGKLVALLGTEGMRVFVSGEGDTATFTEVSAASAEEPDQQPRRGHVI